MSNTPKFQLSAAREVTKALEQKGRVCALCFDTGLGKTHIVAETAARLFGKARSTRIIFYFASNLHLAKLNSEKLAKAMRTAGIKNVKAELSRLVLLPKVIRRAERENPGQLVLIVGLTPGTSMRLRGKGNGEEGRLLWDCRRKHSGYRVAHARQDDYQGLHQLMRKWGAFYDVRRKPRHQGYRQQVAQSILESFGPDLIVLDEFHRYSAHLPQFAMKEEPHHELGLFRDLLRGTGSKTTPLILVSATPYEEMRGVLLGERGVKDGIRTRNHDQFLYLLSRLDSKAYEMWCKERGEHEIDIQKLLREGRADKHELNRLINKLRYKRRLRRVMVDCSRKLVPQFIVRDLKNDPGKSELAFERLAALHSVAQSSWQALWNREQVLSSDNFVTLPMYRGGGTKNFLGKKKGRSKTRRKFHYVLGEHLNANKLNKVALRKWLARSEDLGVWKKEALLNELRYQGLLDQFNRALALWVTPSFHKKRAEKILLFSSVAAVGSEIIETLSDQRCLGIKGHKKWITPFSRHHKTHENPFWIPPRTGWDQIGVGLGRKHHEGKRYSPGIEMLRALEEVLARRTTFAPEKIRTILLEDVHFGRNMIFLRRLTPALEHYFGTAYAKLTIERAMGLKRLTPLKYFKAVTEYCEKFDWVGMWLEYWDYLLGRDPIEREKELVDSIKRVLGVAQRVLGGRKPAHFTSARHRRTGRGRRKIWIQSELADRYGDTVSEAKMSRPQIVQEAFNSPFAPFVLIANSSGQEGLDFHAYCSATMHYEPPTSATDYLQRVGRSFRMRGLAQRRYLAKLVQFPGERHFIWSEVLSKLQRQGFFCRNSDTHAGLVPEFDLPSDANDFVKSIVLVTPHTTEEQRAKRIAATAPFIRCFTHLPPKQQELLLKMIPDQSQTLESSVPKVIAISKGNKNESKK